MKIDRILAIAAGFAMLIGPVQVGLAGSLGSKGQQREVVSPDEEYKLRILEGQVQGLRDSLSTNQREMDQKTAAEWHKQYMELSAVLDHWHASIDAQQ